MFAKSSFISAVLAASFTGALAQSTIYTPNGVSQCQPHKLSWKGQAPFLVSVWPGCDGDVTDDSDAPLATYTTTSTSATWTVNVAAGKSVMLSLTDATGEEVYADEVTIGGSSDTSCLGKAAVFVADSPATTASTGTVSVSSTVVTADPSASTEAAPTTAIVGNVGQGVQSSSTASASQTAVAIGGISGAISSFSPRTELATFITVTSLFAALW